MLSETLSIFTHGNGENLDADHFILDNVYLTVTNFPWFKLIIERITTQIQMECPIQLFGHLFNTA